MHITVLTKGLVTVKLAGLTYMKWLSWLDDKVSKRENVWQMTWKQEKQSLSSLHEYEGVINHTATNLTSLYHFLTVRELNRILLQV